MGAGDGRAQEKRKRLIIDLSGQSGSPDRAKPSAAVQGRGAAAKTEIPFGEHPKGADTCKQSSQRASVELLSKLRFL